MNDEKIISYILSNLWFNREGVVFWKKENVTSCFYPEYETPLSDAEVGKVIEDLVYDVYRNKIPFCQPMGNIPFEIEDTMGNPYHFLTEWEVIEENTKGNLVVQRGNERLYLSPGEWVGGTVSSRTSQNTIEIPQLLLNNINPKDKDQEGWFYFFRGKNPIKSDRIIRYYFHIKAKNSKQQINTVKRFGKMLQSLFDSYDIPFEFKYFNNINRYVQSDSFVLYINQQYFEITALLIAAMINFFDFFLTDPTPLFTKKVYTGVGFAESPIGSKSFGELRSSLIANFLLKNRAQIATQNSQNCSFLQELFIADLEARKYHIKSNEFFRDAGTQFNYPFTLWGLEITYPEEPKNILLQLALKIARKICKESIWLCEGTSVITLTWLTSTADKNQTTVVSNTEHLAILVFFDALSKCKVNEMVIENVRKLAAVEPAIDINNDYFLSVLPAQNCFWKDIYRGLQSKIPLKKKQYKPTLHEITDLLKNDLPLPNFFGHTNFNPTLSHGYAGIGYFLLRFINSELPPIR